MQTENGGGFFSGSSGVLFGLHEVIPFLVGRRGAAHRFLSGTIRAVFADTGRDIRWRTDR